MTKSPPNHHIPKELTISDQDLFEAVSRYGTPLYLYDAEAIIHRWKLLRSILPSQISIFYSVKANPNISVLGLFRELGALFEIASSGELAATQRAGVPGTDVIFVGPGKSRTELQEAIDARIGIVVAESQREVGDLNELSQIYGKATPIALRINPGRGKGAVVMSGTTQFGIDLETALSILAKSNSYGYLDITGIHAYLGTGILDWRVVLDHTHLILHTADELQIKSGTKLRFVDVGGGLGIPYFDRDSEPSWQDLRTPLSSLLNDYIRQHPWTDIVGVESGRFLVGTSGIFITRVLDIKKINDTWFVILDGGTNVFGGDERYRGFRATPVRAVGYDDNTEVRPTMLCGPLCTSLDRLAADIFFPLVQVGDLVAFYQAGAYGLSASPGLFLSHGFPAEVLAQNGNLQLIRERFKPIDLLISQTSKISSG